MTDLNHIAVFMKVVEAGSFSAAARALRTPKATVSRNIARLESDLGARLLHRTTRKLELTAQGRGFYGEVARGMAHLDAAREQIAAAQSEPTGTLRVTAPVGFGSHPLVQWIAEFLEKFQKISIELRLTDAYVDLIEERIDLALRTGQLPSSSLIARKLAPSRRILVASTVYLQQHGAPVRLDDLQRHACIVFGQPLDSAVWRLEGPNGVREIAVSGRLAVDDALAAFHATIGKLGIALLPYAIVADDLRAGRLKHVLARYRVDGGLFAVYPSNRHISAALRAFLDFIAIKAATLPG
jgi:DNA-binding transcriptional LysR family regulator